MAIIYVKPLLDEITQGHIQASKQGKPYSDDEFKRAQKLNDFYYAAKDITEYVIYLGFYEDMLKAVLEGFINANKIIKPSKKFIFEFHSIVQTLKESQEEKEILKNLPKFNFDDYGNLDFNIAWMIDNLPQKIQELESYRARVQQVFYNTCKGDYYYPPYLEDEIKELESNIKQHKKKKGLLLLTKELKETLNLDLPFKKRNSKKERVYNVLKSLFDQNISTNELSKKAKVKVIKIAGIILQLRNDLKKYRPDLMIDSKNKSGYKLTHLAS